MGHKVTVQKVDWDGLASELEGIEKPQVSNQKSRKFGIIVSAFIVVLLIGTSFGIMISATTPSIPTVIEPGSMVGDASYIIFTDGTNYYAKNGTTGSIDYSGANATTLIQAVMTALMPDGGIIKLRVGDYNIPYPGLMMLPNITLEGEGIGTNLVCTGTERTLFLNSNVTIREIRFTGVTPRDCVSSYPGNYSDIMIDRCIFESAGNPNAVVYFDNPCYRVTIQKCTFAPVLVLGSMVIRTYHGAFFSILDNEFLGSKATAIYLDSTQNSTIRGNNFVNCPVGAADYFGTIDIKADFATGLTSNVIISNNQFIWTVDYASLGTQAIEITATNPIYDVIVRSVLVEGNIIEGIGTAGMVGIYTHDDGAGGHSPKGIILVNNIIRNVEQAIINIGQNCTITGNIASGVRNGICSLGARSIIANNIFLGNSGVGNSYGIAVIESGAPTDGGSFIVSNNRIDNFATGISENHPTSNPSHNDSIMGNVITNCNTPIVLHLGSNSIVHYNLGYATENSGVATITGAFTSITVNHGLNATPTIVIVTVNNTGAGNYSVSSITLTQFVISFTNQPAASIWEFYWYAEV